ncbi:hypothetical protein [Granulicella sp. L60]|jgi:hypothetical protein|uniref:hypothetical protein n=1 Tax=Granulicella sp. L60 TaxID=1641866 RepID=UPI00131E60E1|nr:hypothetical protein [Granulicella sp. L60]
MSTAAFPGSINPIAMQRRMRSVPSLSKADAAASVDLTIHRITKTHHGRTLLTLGHAAEYLAHSRRFQIDETEDSSAEAIHILMELSRSVFDEFAEQIPVSRRVERWLTQSVVGLFC